MQSLTVQHCCFPCLVDMISYQLAACTRLDIDICRRFLRRCKYEHRVDLGITYKCLLFPWSMSWVVVVLVSESKEMLLILFKPRLVNVRNNQLDRNEVKVGSKCYSVTHLEGNILMEMCHGYWWHCHQLGDNIL